MHLELQEVKFGGVREEKRWRVPDHMEGEEVADNCDSRQEDYSLADVAPAAFTGMPSNADRLWVYENFSWFGGIAEIRILYDLATGLCNGTW
jgi:hypothetical protein